MKKLAIFPMLLVVSMASASYADVFGSGAGGSFVDMGNSSSVINIGASEVITDLELTINGMTHTWIGDLTATLQSPGGTTVSLFDVITGGIGDSSDFGGNYDFSDDGADLWATASGLGSGQIIPSGDYFAADGSNVLQSLSTLFDGEDTAGNWTLNFFDAQNGDTGGWLGWDLRITSAGAPVVPEPGTLSLIALIGMVGLARRRRRA